jgi:hypothetical protein
MKETDIEVVKAGQQVGLLLTASKGGFGRGKESQMILLSQEQATALRDRLNEALR